jgi:hypothetical protein
MSTIREASSPASLLFNYQLLQTAESLSLRSTRLVHYKFKPLLLLFNITLSIYIYNPSIYPRFFSLLPSTFLIVCGYCYLTHARTLYLLAFCLKDLFILYSIPNFCTPGVFFSCPLVKKGGRHFFLATPRRQTFVNKMSGEMEHGHERLGRRRSGAPTSSPVSPQPTMRVVEIYRDEDCLHHISSNGALSFIQTTILNIYTIGRRRRRRRRRENRNKKTAHLFVCRRVEQQLGRRLDGRGGD